MVVEVTQDPLDPCAVNDRQVFYLDFLWQQLYPLVCERVDDLQIPWLRVLIGDKPGSGILQFLRIYIRSSAADDTGRMFDILEAGMTDTNLAVVPTIHGEPFPLKCWQVTLDVNQLMARLKPSLTNYLSQHRQYTRWLWAMKLYDSWRITKSPPPPLWLSVEFEDFAFTHIVSSTLASSLAQVRSLKVYPPKSEWNRDRE